MAASSTSLSAHNVLLGNPKSTKRMVVLALVSVERCLPSFSNILLIIVLSPYLHGLKAIVEVLHALYPHTLHNVYGCLKSCNEIDGMSDTLLYHIHVSGRNAY